MKYKDFNFNLPHNEDKPDFIWTNRKEWYSNGLHHRINGPAVIWKNGDEEWFVNGKRHRTDGPAVTLYYDNFQVQEWWINGTDITTKVKKWMKLRNYSVNDLKNEEVKAEFLLMFME